MATLEEAIRSLNALVKDRPELESGATQSIEDLTKQLQHLQLTTATATATATATDDKYKPIHTIYAPKHPSTPDPIQKIREGFQDFKIYFKKEHALFESLAKSQHPKIMIVGCVDSRVDQALTLGLGFGEAFTLRNVANLIHPKHSNHISVAAAMEYAILHLKVEHLIVIGHSRCGGINALLRWKEDGSNKFSDHIEDWILVAKSAAKQTKNEVPADRPFDEHWEICAKESVKASLWNALTYPFVKEAVQSKKLALHGAYFDFIKGSFEHWSFNYNFTEPEFF